MQILGGLRLGGDKRMRPLATIAGIYRTAPRLGDIRSRAYIKLCTFPTFVHIGLSYANISNATRSVATTQTESGDRNDESGSELKLIRYQHGASEQVCDIEYFFSSFYKE